MKVLGIVAEYNPFHLGHKYQLSIAKQKSGCDAVAIVMSGNYVQRGEPSIIDKYTRAKIACQSGADLVIELPFPFSCQSAELFSQAAIKELKKLNVSVISFGCENANINILEKIACLQLNNKEQYNTLLKHYMSIGLSYPNAINNVINDMNIDNLNGIGDIILSPNNTLGLEYIKACKLNDFKVDFLPIKRHIAQHNDKSITHNIASATSIRNELYKHNMINTKKSLTKSSYNEIIAYYKSNKIFNRLDYFLNMIYYKILIVGKQYLRTIYDVTEGLENKIYDNVYKYNKLDDYILSIKSKRYTYARIRRILLNILLDITTKDIEELRQNTNNYIKVLAFNDNGKKILSSAKKNNQKIITKFSDFKRNGINASNDKTFELTSKASNIYYLPYKEKEIYINNEFKNTAIYIK